MAKRKGRPQGVVVNASSRATKAPPADDETAAAAELPAETAVTLPAGKKKKRKTASEPAPVEAPKAAVPAGVADTAAAQPPPQSPFDENVGPAAAAAGALAWLVWPLTPAVFFAEYWEKKPLHLRRGQPAHHREVFSKAALEQHLSAGTPLPYGQRLNLARFDEEAGKKIDLNKGPRGTQAILEDVHAAWAEGATIQAMHMQQFHEPVWRLLAALEAAFGALFGSNSYLTPAGRQGLAPHFDDVEVFMLQLEGSKRWRLWAPPAGEEFPLPREYSRDFAPRELGEPLLDCVLEPGDLLYFPRGTVHAGVATGDAEGGGAAPAAFSHHLTVSTYQRLAWCQLLDRALAGAVGRAAAASPDFREGLPVGFLGYTGSWHANVGSRVMTGGVVNTASEVSGGGRAAFLRNFKALLRRVEEFVDLDDVCDELGVDFTSARLPPAAGAKAKAQGGPKTSPEAEAETAPAAAAPSSAKARALGPASRVRWVEPSAARLMLGTDPESSEATVMLFHSCANERGGHMSKPVEGEVEEDVGCLRFEASTFLPALKQLLALGSASIRCADLALQAESDRVALCENLLEAGLLELEVEAP